MMKFRNPRCMPINGDLVPADVVRADDLSADELSDGASGNARPMVVLHEPGWFHVLPALLTLGVVDVLCCTDGDLMQVRGEK